MKRNVHFAPELQHLVQIPDYYNQPETQNSLPISYRWIQGLRLLSIPEVDSEHIIRRFGSLVEIDGNVFFISQQQEGNAEIPFNQLPDEIDLRGQGNPIVYRSTHNDALMRSRGRLVGSLVDRTDTEIPVDLKNHLIRTGLVRACGRYLDDFLWISTH